MPVVVYAHSLPLYSSNPKGYITISYAMRELRRDAAAILSDNSYHAVVTFCDQLIYATDADLYERWDPSLSADENESLLFPIIMPILPFRTPIRCSVPTMCPPQSI